MYKEGMLLTRHGMETPVVRDIEESLKGMVEVTEKKGYEGVDEWEVDERLGLPAENPHNRLQRWRPTFRSSLLIVQ